MNPLATPSPSLFHAVFAHHDVLVVHRHSMSLSRRARRDQRRWTDGFNLDFLPNDPDEQHLRLRFVSTSGVVTWMRAGLESTTGLIEACSSPLSTPGETTAGDLSTIKGGESARCSG